MLQLEDVRQDLHRIAGAKKMPDSDYVKFKQYLNQVADNLEQAPMYRTVEPIEEMRAAFIARSKKLAAHKSRMVSSIDAWASDQPSADLWYHGGIGEVGELEHGFFTKDIKRAVDYATAAGDKGKVYVVSGTEGLKLAAPGEMSIVGKVSPVKVFDVWEGFDISKLRAISPREQWWAKKESAMAKARTQYELDFTDYSNRNMVDAAMRMVFPFWTYEWQRYFWLPRTFLRTPGTATGLGRYMEYSDQGYIPVPGTNIQFNPTRGTVFMGGFRRMMLRDFPEYYDAFPGMEVIDFISRMGFYPGIHVMLPIIITGALTGKPEWGEVLPAWSKTGLNAARAIAPEAAGKVIDHIFPDRFRDYLTMLQLGDMGYDADEIWRKKKC